MISCGCLLVQPYSSLVPRLPRTGTRRNEVVQLQCSRSGVGESGNDDHSSRDEWIKWEGLATRMLSQ